MKLFIWPYVENCTNNYHTGGGVVVVAESESAAVALAKEKGCNISDNEMADHTYEVGDRTPEVFIFPDAGCC